MSLRLRCYFVLDRSLIQNLTQIVHSASVRKLCRSQATVPTQAESACAAQSNKWRSHGMNVLIIAWRALLAWQWMNEALACEWMCELVYKLYNTFYLFDISIFFSFRHFVKWNKVDVIRLQAFNCEELVGMKNNIHECTVHEPCFNHVVPRGMP